MDIYVGLKKLYFAILRNINTHSLRLLVIWGYFSEHIFFIKVP